MSDRSDRSSSFNRSESLDNSSLPQSYSFPESMSMSQSETTSSFSYLENTSDRGSLGLNGQAASVETLDFESLSERIEPGPVLNLNGNGDGGDMAGAIAGGYRGDGDGYGKDRHHHFEGLRSSRKSERALFKDTGRSGSRDSDRGDIRDRDLRDHRDRERGYRDSVRSGFRNKDYGFTVSGRHSADTGGGGGGHHHHHREGFTTHDDQSGLYRRSEYRDYRHEDGTATTGRRRKSEYICWLILSGVVMYAYYYY